MALLAPKKIVLSEINNGNQYNLSDGIQPNAINDPIQAAAWAQALATNEPNTENVGEVGTPSVGIEMMQDGTPRLYFSHLKGEHGADHTLEISEIKDDIEVLEKRVSEREDTLNDLVSKTTVIDNRTLTLSKRTSVVEKRVENIEKGMLPERFVIDDNTSYKKVVPANSAPYAMISMIGGASVIGDDGVAKSAVVPVIYLESANLIPFPYFEPSNTRDGVTFTALNDGRVFVDGKANGVSSYFVFKNSNSAIYLSGTYYVSGLISGTKFQARDAANKNYTVDKDNPILELPSGYYSVRLYAVSNIQLHDTVGVMLNKVSAELPYSPWHEPKVAFGVYNHTNLIGYGQGNPLDENEYNYIDYDDMKYYQVGELIDGVWTTFENPVVTSLDYLFIDNYFEVEQGGTLVFENEYQLPVPSEVTFQLRGGSV